MSVSFAQIVERLMLPVSRFGGGGSNARGKKKETVIEKLKAFFEKYFGLFNLNEAEDGDAERKQGRDPE